MKLIKVGNQFINVERVNCWEMVETATASKLVLYFNVSEQNWIELRGDKANEVRKWLERHAEPICEEYSDSFLKAFWKMLKWLARLEQQEATAKQMNGQQEPTAKSSHNEPTKTNGNGQTATTGVQHVKPTNIPSSR